MLGAGARPDHPMSGPWEAPGAICWETRRCGIFKSPGGIARRKVAGWACAVRGCSCPRSYRFSGTGSDPEATQILSKAYDIACRSLHRKGQPPVVQELLARKIIEAAQHGERDPDRLAGIALGMLGPVHREVSQRFGLVPNFFCRPRMRPRLSRSCGISPSAYLDSPIPAVFKERLFVFLSRFCQVRYCIARHCAFLVGYGHASGDVSAARHTIEQALKLLKVPPPWRRPLEPIYERLEAFRSVIDWARA